MIHVHLFEGGSYRLLDGPDALGRVPDLLASGARLWVDADSHDDAFAAFLTTVLKLHPLAVEDILQDRPSPKIEDYGDYLYLVAHGIARDKGKPDSLCTVELDMVLASQWILTHHLGASQACLQVEEELRRNPRPLERGPAYIAHAVLDNMVDYFLPVMDDFDEEVDAIEGQVIDNPSRELLGQLFDLKRSLQRLRRVAVYQREVLKRLANGEFDLIPEKSLPFFRDVYDHFLRVADLADSYRELLSGALDAYLSVVSNRMNEVMKALTLVATIMMPLTFIAGVYGMNFHNMPELSWQWGYPFALCLMATVAAGMALWFRYRRWM